MFRKLRLNDDAIFRSKIKVKVARPHETQLVTPKVETRRKIEDGENVKWAHVKSIAIFEIKMSKFSTIKNHYVAIKAIVCGEACERRSSAS